MSVPNQINKFNTVQLPINFALAGASNEFGIAGRGGYDYQWIFVLSIILAFCAAWGIGANDVANSFATSVGSKTLKMWQAVIIAGLCEFFGAYLLGSRVTDTIRSGIVDVNTFIGHDDLLMFGMLCSITAIAFWLFLATTLELPVSTTHTAVGSIIGFALCSPAGGAAVKWYDVGMIVVSWVAAPCLCAVAAGTLFFLVRKFILRSENAFDRAFLFFPVLVFITVSLNVIFIMFKGVTKGQGFASSSPKLSTGAAFGVSFGVGGLCFLIFVLILGPYLKRYINSLSHDDLVMMAAEKGNLALTVEEAQKVKELKVEDESNLDKVEAGTAAITDDSNDILKHNRFTREVGPIEAFFDRIFHQNMVHAPVTENATVASIHGNAEIFPLKIEYTFGFLQVFTAMFASFAHGANDVANSIGPLATVVSIFETGVGAAQKKAGVPDWILVLGGAGIAFGFAMYGHIIVAAMGVKMVKITPTRGFCVELSAAFIIVIGSFVAIPLSTTQVAIGGIVGVGIIENNIKNSVNWKLLAKVFCGWAATLIIAGLTSALLFSWGTFSPSQYYPVNPVNCLKTYGQFKNESNNDPSSYVVPTQSGLVVGIIGYPSTGAVGGFP